MGASDDVVEFDGFELDRARFVLRRDGEVVAVERQVFDLISYLVGNAGRVVTKNELLDDVWGTRFVTESALTTQIKFARRALGDNGTEQRYIRTAHGRGYEFVGGARTTVPGSVGGRDRTQRDSTGSAGTSRHAEMVPLIGRDGAVADLEVLLADRRLITLVGPGGIGKTQLALEIAATHAGSHRDGVVVVDLAAATSPGRVAQIAAEAAGLGLREGAAVADALAGLEALIVIDNCEHLVDEAAAFVDRVLAQPDDPVQVIATSREPLAIAGEEVMELGPLSVHAPDGASSDAAQLFVARAGRHGSGLQLTEVERLVRLLDGLPLAIELAAAQLHFMNTEELRERLEQHRYALAVERRDSEDRLGSLTASVAWSWELLDDDERLALTELGVFASDFGLDAVEGVTSVGEPLAVLRRLRGKSLVSTLRTDGPTRFRLLFGVRDFVRPFQAAHPAGAAGLRRRLRRWLADWLDEWTFEEQYVSAEYLATVLREWATIRDLSASGASETEAPDATDVARLLSGSATAFRFGSGVIDARRRIDLIDGIDLPDDVAARLALASSEAAYAMGDIPASRRQAVRADDLASSCGRDDLRAVALMQQCLGRTLDEPVPCADTIEQAIGAARHASTPRIEAVAAALQGLCVLGFHGDVAAAQRFVDEAEARSAPVGWDRVCVDTVRGTIRMLAGDGESAVADFGRIADAMEASGLRGGASSFRLLALTCRAEDADTDEIRTTIERFLREANRATGYDGRGDALLLLGRRAARHGDVDTARRLISAISNRRLSHLASTLIARAEAKNLGLDDVPPPAAEASRPDPALAAMLDDQLVRL